MRELPHGWRFARLDELGTVERGRSRHRPRNDPSLYGGEYPFVQTGDIKAAGLRLYRYTQTYNEAGLAQSRLWPCDTLCITIAANICDTAILGISACFPDSVVGFTPSADVADVVFVKYALDHAKQRFGNISRGATQDNLSLEKLLSQQLSIPPVEEQRRIASILGAYDDLIEVNRRRIVLMEEMARNLFEEWFVRFHFPGHKGHELVVTPYGPVPQNWRLVRLNEIARVNANVVKSTDAPDRVGYVDIASVSQGEILSVDWQAFSDAPGRARRRVRDGSIIWSTVRPNRRSYALIVEPDENLIVSTGFAVLDPYGASSSYLYHYVTTDQFVGYLVGNTTGAAYPAVTGATFERAIVLVPPEDLDQKFSAFAEPLLRAVDKLRKQNVRLASSRALLLPGLISGRLSVSSAEQELEAVA